MKPQPYINVPEARFALALLGLSPAMGFTHVTTPTFDGYVPFTDGVIKYHPTGGFYTCTLPTVRAHGIAVNTTKPACALEVMHNVTALKRVATDQRLAKAMCPAPSDQQVADIILAWWSEARQLSYDEQAELHAFARKHDDVFFRRALRLIRPRLWDLLQVQRMALNTLPGTHELVVRILNDKPWESMK